MVADPVCASGFTMSNDNTKDSDKIAVNGEEAALDATKRNQITLQLLENGGVKRVEAKLKQALDETGWSQAIREQADVLFRSGEVTTYDECMQRILEMMKNNENGPTREGSTPTSLQPTREALEHGATQVKKELEGIMVLKKK